MKRLVPLALTLALAPAVARPSFAQGGGSGGEQLPADAPAVTPDGEKAKAELAALAKDPRSAKLAGAAMGKARAALSRAHGAHLAKDAAGARDLSRVALAWAKAARAVLRANEVEQRAKEAQTKAEDLKERLERAKALLVETEARKAPLSSEIARVEAESKRSTDKALDAEKKRTTVPKAGGGNKPTKGGSKTKGKP
jgi:chromosome segregation ATPase